MNINDFLKMFRKNPKEMTTTNSLENEEIIEPQLDLRDIPPGIMAYLGDSVYEMIVRTFFVRQGMFRSHELHQQVIDFVNAKAQAELLRYLEDKLTDQEKIILRRGRNSNAGNVPRNADVADYRYSTAFEAILGYLLLREDHERLAFLISEIEAYLRMRSDQ